MTRRSEKRFALVARDGRSRSCSSGGVKKLNRQVSARSGRSLSYLDSRHSGAAVTYVLHKSDHPDMPSATAFYVILFCIMRILRF